MRCHGSACPRPAPRRWDAVRAAWAWWGGLAFAALAGGCGGPPAPWSEPPAASIAVVASVDVARVPLMGEFELRVDVYRRSDLPVEFDPQVPAGCTGSVELLPETALGAGHWRRAVLRLRAVQAPGELVIAPYSARATDGTMEVASAPVTLQVDSLLGSDGADGDPAGSAATLEAPGPLLERRNAAWPVAVALGAVLLVLALVGLLLKLRRDKPAPPATVALPAHVKALRELSRLRGAPRGTPAEIDRFYVEVSQVLRVYLEERFGLRAPERTTEEFLQEIEKGGPLSVAQCLELRPFLQQCDLVKFAGQVPPDLEHLKTLAVAEQFVEATRTDRGQPAEAVA